MCVFVLIVEDMNIIVLCRIVANLQNDLKEYIVF